MNELDLISLYCIVDDFFQAIGTALLSLEEVKKPKATRKPSLTMSEIVTIIIYIQHSGFRCFKYYYERGDLKKYFPKMPSYSRFVSLMRRSMLWLWVFLQSVMGTCTGISYIDSTPISVCHVGRCHSHKTFRSLAKKGKTSTG